MTELMKEPIAKPPGAQFSNVVSGRNRPTIGVTRSETAELTTEVNEEATTTPTAISSTLPREMNSLNSFSMMVPSIVPRRRSARSRLAHGVRVKLTTVLQL